MRCSAALREAVAQAPAALAGGLRGVGHARSRGDVHDRAPTALEHARQHGLAQHQRGHGIGLKVFVEQVERRVQDPVHMTRSDVTTVVDQHVDAAPSARSPAPRRLPAKPGPADRRAAEKLPLPSARTNSAVAERLPGRARVSLLATVEEISRDSPSFSVRALIATSKPARARWTAIALPMPRLAPVTNATFRLIPHPFPDIGSLSPQVRPTRAEPITIGHGASHFDDLNA